MSQWPSLLTGKSLYNPPGPRSAAYDEFPKQFDPSKNGFDFHMTQFITCPAVPAQAQYAKELHERVRREFPELRIYKLWDKPIGPHPTAMFEVNTFNPHQTGAFFSWLVVHRGPCDVLVHPNTGDSFRDHTELATWIGRRWPLYDELLKTLSLKRK
ncbi:DOPA-like domain-containing protein [Suillus ampliporus]|nr:DOPA-like domain-containing protein [Suillus ampliporus]